jgi:hypothetical protein
MLCAQPYWWTLPLPPVPACSPNTRLRCRNQRTSGFSRMARIGGQEISALGALLQTVTRPAPHGAYMADSLLSARNSRCVSLPADLSVLHNTRAR